MPDLSSITAAILAGGLGTRLRSAVADRPKGLALIRGRPFLAWQLDQLAAAGIRDVVLCTGHMADMIERELGPTHGPIRLRYSPETTPLGTGGALGLASRFLTSDTVMVLNGDSYCHADFAGFFAFHQQHPLAPSIFLTRVPDISRYGQVVTDSQNRVTRFAEKSPPTTPPTSGYINAGIYLLPRPLIAAIPHGRPVSIEKEIFPAAIPAPPGPGLYAF
ncbi:MAG TPA: sugar phosphate nucleotidyltransferase, partial [Phycisphaerae bacterium]|nr:sugar phosphate nucleotidyltransferase [Phycisphaerae bacterium]